MPDHRAPEPDDAPAVEVPAPVVDTEPEPPAVPAPAAPEPPADEVVAERPEPVMDAAKLAGKVSGAILGVGGLLKFLGLWIPANYDLDGLADAAGNAVLALGAGWALVGPAITAAIKARNKVTPLSDPRDAAGNRLTPEGT